MNKTQVSKLVGKQVYAVHRNGSTIVGKLVRISGHTAYIQPLRNTGKKVKTSAILPLVLYDLLAIGYYGGYGGYGPAYGYNPYGYGAYPGAYGGFFW